MTDETEHDDYLTVGELMLRLMAIGVPSHHAAEAAITVGKGQMVGDELRDEIRAAFSRVLPENPEWIDPEKPQ